MSNLKTTAKSNHRIFESLNVYHPDEYIKNLPIQHDQHVNNSLFTSNISKSPKKFQDYDPKFFSSYDKSPQKFQEIEPKHYNYLKAQNQEIFSSKNRCAMLESEIAKINKVHTIEISELKQKISEYEKNLILSNSENDRICNTLITLNSELDHWKKEYSILESKFLQYSLENEKMFRNNKHMENELSKWKEKTSCDENNIFSVLKEMEQMKEKLKSHNEIVDGFEKELEIRDENYLKLQSLCMRLRNERDSLFEKNEKLENLLQASSEDYEEIKSRYNKLMEENEKKFEEIKKDESKVLVEINLKYQELLNRKNMLDEQYKQIVQQNKELNQKLLMNENALQDKNHKILELEMKWNSHDDQVEELIKELGVKDQLIYKLKTENIRSGYKFDNKSYLSQSKNIINDIPKNYEMEENLNKIISDFEDEKKEKEKMKEKISHLLKTLLLTCAENDRLHQIIQSYKS